MSMPPIGDAENLRRRLANRRALARVTLLFERLWPAVWPAVGLAGAFLCLALLDVPALLPGWGHLALVIGFGLGIAGLLIRGLRGVRVPDASVIDRRLEVASRLGHRPLAALVDRPTGTDAASQALWQAHVARAATQLAKLRVGPPRPGLAARDRRALRGALVVALAAAFGIAGGDSWPRILRALSPQLPAAQAAQAPMVQAWITPPAYTGVAPIFLHPEGGAVSVPAGSHLTVSVTGGMGEPTLTYDGRVDRFRTLDAGSFQADRDLTIGGRLSVRRLGRTVAGWDVTAVADTPPTVAWAEPPGQAPRGLQTRLPWTTQDDYGVVSLTAQLTLAGRPDAPPLVVTIPLAGVTKTAHGVALPDLSAHPWAGLEVTARLIAKDFPGQTGQSDVARFVLPERPFHHPVARAVIALRKALSLHPQARDDVIHGLGEIAGAPKAFDNDTGAFVNLSAIAALLADNAAPGAVDDAQQRMWELALHLEEGGAERTQRDLEAARDAVRQQLEAMRDPNLTPAQRDQQTQELERRLQALREAIQKHLQALAEQARRDGDVRPYDPSMPQLNPRDMDRMAQQMLNDAQQGKMDDAQKEMAQLEQMLQQLQNARPQQSQDRQNAQRQQRGRQQMSAVQDMVQRESKLLDKAQGRAQQSPDAVDQTPQGDDQQAQNQPGQDQQAQQPGAQQPGGQRQQDTKVQHSLRRALGELMQQYGDLTGQVPQPLTDADTAMRDAGDALAQGRDGAASANQQRAIAALQKGGQQMSDQMSQQFGMSMQLGDGQGQDGGAGDQGDGSDMQTGDNDSGLQGPQGQGHGLRRGGQRDPLGRLTQGGSSGTDESSDVRVPDQMERARTRDIQNELRRRGADRTRPEEELQYIDRLLKPF
jgi:uncharacterized protein (TIGR02302 family)